MKYVSLALLSVPLLALGILLLGRNLPERTLSWVVRGAYWLQGLLFLSLLFLWFRAGFPAVEIPLGELYARGDYHFFVCFFIDTTTMIFLGVTLFLLKAVIRFSLSYLYGEPGYYRFFSGLFLFSFGIEAVFLAGTLDLLFAGWEAVGLSSFLLIAFYYERRIPVRNALKVFSVYRFCDLGLLLGAWMGHLIWHHSQHFSELANLAGTTALASVGEGPLLGLSLLLLLTAAGKSGQFPFLYWVPRAMEGPTPSSAIFYGAISIHAGVYLLMRTYPLWQASPWAPWCVGGVGVLTIFFSHFAGHVQSNIKGQIAYASSAQAGWMFLELSLGFYNLVLFHFATHACFRCYQLLVSPSVVAFQLRRQNSKTQVKSAFQKTVSPTAYAFGLQEGYAEAALRRCFWDPAKHLGHAFRLIPFWIVLVFVSFVLVFFPHLEFLRQGAIAAGLFYFALAAFAEKSSWLRIWNFVFAASLGAALLIWIVDSTASTDITIYLAGIVPAWALGFFSLTGVRRRSLGNERLGAFLFFLAFLGLAGFPIGPGFLGEDLLLHHASGTHLWLSGVIALAFVLNGLTLSRLFARVVWEPYHS